MNSIPEGKTFEEYLDQAGELVADIKLGYATAGANYVAAFNLRPEDFWAEIKRRGLFPLAVRAMMKAAGWVDLTPPKQVSRFDPVRRVLRRYVPIMTASERDAMLEEIERLIR